MPGKITNKIMEEYSRIKEELELHNYKYYTLASPSISDSEYDKLFKKLVELEDTYPELKTPDSPSQRVGGKLTEEFVKVAHSVPMLSLDNTYNENDIKEFHSRVLKNLNKDKVNYVSELKIDGVSISIRYKNGILVQAITRGDGVSGEDVTLNIRTVRSVPLKLSKEIDIEVRGEIFMPKSEFERINEERDREGLNVFANPRNATAGTLKLLDSSEVSKRKLDSFMYYIISPQSYNLKSQKEVLEFLFELGFKVNNTYKPSDSIEEIIEYWKYWDNSRKTVDYDIDGVVVKVDSFEEQRDLGETVRSPRWGIAFKFTAERKLTKLYKITLQVGSTGIITPVAELEPLQLEGTTVKRASLHNFEYIKEKDIREGDYVYVEKAGGIIPQIISVETSKRDGSLAEVNIPEVCPVCGGKTGKTNPVEVAVRCLNPFCEAKLIRMMENFVSIDGMNIEGLGPKLLERIVGAGLIKDLADIYYLDGFKLATLGSGIGQKIIANLLNQIENSKQNPLDRLLFALGIPLVGKKTGKDLAVHFKSLDEIMNTTIHGFMEVEGIGEDVARSIKTYFAEEHTQKVVKKLKEAGVNTTYNVENIDGILSGMIISQTGELSQMTRKEFEKYVESLGGIFSDNVTKKTKILVVGDAPGSKLEKARKFGIPVMNEGEFFEHYKK